MCVCVYTLNRFFVRATNIPEAEVSAELSLHVCFCTFATVSLCSLSLFLSLTVEQSGKKHCVGTFSMHPLSLVTHTECHLHTQHKLLAITDPKQLFTK